VGEWISTNSEAKQFAQLQATTERSARTQAEAKLTAAIPQLIGLGLSIEQVAQSLGLTIAEVQAVVENR
jgi:predicted transposase YdaD